MHEVDKAKYLGNFLSSKQGVIRILLKIEGTRDGGKYHRSWVS